jgi:metal-dependent hydrolase (beta-lactamase superfamily II)
MSDERHVFISHIHEDDEHVQGLKDLLAKQGMDVKNGSITKDKFNEAQSENYIKGEILKPRIEWASVLVVLVSRETKDSDWVNWEIECAQQTDTRIVAVYEHGEAGVELPDAAKDYADAVVGWNTDKIIDAIAGQDCWEEPDGSARPPQPMRRQAKC